MGITMKYILLLVVIFSTLIAAEENVQESHMEKPVVGATYQHYSGKKYRILHIANSADNLELLVVYQALYDDEVFGNNNVWVRPLEEFMSMVMIKGIEQKRFKECET
jgi:hypothetical protein